MLEKVLFATDFSELADKAMEFLKKLRDSVNEVVVVHVVDEKEIETVTTTIAWIGETTEKYEEELRKKLKEKAEEEMEKLKEKLEEEGFKVKTVVTEGHPAEKIIEIVEKENVAAILMGSHGRSNLKAALLGSVSEEVIRKANKPVIVVRRETS